jgi:hypothetical protein
MLFNVHEEDKLYLINTYKENFSPVTNKTNLGWNTRTTIKLFYIYIKLEIDNNLDILIEKRMLVLAFGELLTSLYRTWLMFKKENNGPVWSGALGPPRAIPPLSL